MKLVIVNAGLIAAFEKVEGKEGVVKAKVLSGSNSEVARLTALGGAPIDLAIEGLTKGHTLTMGEEVQFTADGTFAVEPSITAPAEKAEEVRKTTGGASPAMPAERSNRFTS
jgi:hypothetical protein